MGGCGLVAEPIARRFRYRRPSPSARNEIVAIHPRAEEVNGAVGYRRLADVPGETPIDVVDCFVNSQRVGAVVDDAIAERDALMSGRSGCSWESLIEPAAQRAHAAGLEVVMDACPAIEVAAAWASCVLVLGCQDAAMDLTSFQALSFDCYGTSSTGRPESRRSCGRGPTRVASIPPTSSCCSAYGDNESAVQREQPGALYPGVLAAAFKRIGHVLATPEPIVGAATGQSRFRDWPAFPTRRRHCRDWLGTIGSSSSRTFTGKASPAATSTFGVISQQ